MKRPIEYVVPLRWDNDHHLAEFTAYLEMLAAIVDVTVVDGSPDEIFAEHGRAWPAAVRHLRPRPWPGRNGKVAGVVTGVQVSRHDWVVIADDDVRYTSAQLMLVVAPLADGSAALVRPQNVFSPAPWHARWDTGRSLINRAVGADYPGTFALRRSVFLEMGGYDGDVLFENLQMLRTFGAVGGVEYVADDLFVARRPPTVSGFLSQRVRQAYDDFAQPGRLIFEAMWLPAIIVALRRAPAVLVVEAAAAMLVAERGRRRHSGRSAFPSTSALWAPLWVAERAVCVWLAIGVRLRGGVRYRGRRMPAAARAVTCPRTPLAVSSV